MRARCAIVGGGPAGVMLGYLLARAGVDVIVLEKRADFFRDFRGDTIHPSTLELFAELGLLERLLRIPHSVVRSLIVRIGGAALRIGDFSRLPAPTNYLALMPQWDFLDFLVREARRYPAFAIEKETDVFDLIRDGKKTAGVLARSPRGIVEVRADLVVAADGRTSKVCECDVLWMRISRRGDDAHASFGNVAPGAVLITINRDEYYQMRVGHPERRVRPYPRRRPRCVPHASRNAGTVSARPRW